MVEGEDDQIDLLDDEDDDNSRRAMDFSDLKAQLTQSK